MTERRARILVVEDETNLAEGIRENLQAEGYEVDLAGDGAEGLERIRADGYDLVILDVMMPRMDGFTMCEHARREGHEVPVLFLTAKGETGDRIRGLEAGADDYLTKPFHLRELLLRVGAILRRGEWYRLMPAAGETIRFGGNEVDLRTYRGRSWDGQEYPLSEKETMILKLLHERQGQAVTREEVMDRVWGYELHPSTRAIESLVERLRRRFERDPSSPRHLHTVRGVGYRFDRGGEYR